MVSPRWNMRRIAASALILLSGIANAQCPQLFDGTGTPSDAPVWVSCSGNNFTLVLGSPTAIGPFTVDWGDGSPIYSGAGLIPPQTVSHPYAAAVATYTVTLTEPGTGCVVTGTLTMEKSTSASIQIPLGGLTQACAPQALDFINSSTNTSPNTVFQWNFGDGTGWITYDYTNLGQVLSHTYMPGTVGCETQVRLRAQNTCNTLQGGPSLASFNPIRVWDTDTANIAPSATLLCWPDNEVTYLNTTDRNCLSQGNIYQRFEYWNYGDYWGTGHDSIVDWTPWPPTFPHTIAYPGIGSYDVMMLDSNYCGVDTAFITINIVPPPSVTLNANPTTICPGYPVQFTQTNTGGANYFEWDFAEGNGFENTSSGDQSHTFNTAGTYNVNFAASIQGSTAGCADTAMATVTVLPSPTAQFTLDHDAACSSITVDVTNNTLNSVNQNWDFGDGNTDTQFAPPPHTYSTPGTYVISLTAYNNMTCDNTVTDTVHVYTPPQPVIGAQNVCEGSPAQFADLTITEPGNAIVQWAWDFGDGATSTDQAPTHMYTAGGDFTVTLTVTTPYCSGTSSTTFHVEPKPAASFNTDTLSGCSPLQVQFSNTSTGAANSIWHFGDGGSDNNTSPTHSYSNFGNVDSVYTAMLIAGTVSGCSDTAVTTITVSPTVLALFTHNALAGCAPLAVTFTNNSTGATSYLWDFGDGITSAAQNPSHTYVNHTGILQTINVTLTATNWAGCSSTTQASFIVYPAPHFTFSAVPDSGCAPLTVTFPAVIGAITYQWNFGDGSTGSGPNPVHTYLNNSDSTVHFPVTLVASNAFGCTDSTAGVIPVYPAPIAQFNLSGTTGCHPLATTLTNASSGAVSYHWNYGDGLQSDTTAILHGHTWTNFQGPGAASFPVSLTATSDRGCTSSAAATVQVFPQVTAAFVSDSAGCSPMDPGFINLSTGATTYMWTFGDGSGSLLQHPVHAFANQGVNDVVFHPFLIASSSFGCSDTATADVLVHPAPIAQFTASPTTGCSPAVTAFNDMTIGASSMNWMFGDGTFQNAAPGNITHTYVNTGNDPATFMAHLTATSPFGCTDTLSAPVQVYPSLTAQFQLPQEACSPAAITLEDQGQGGVQWIWAMGDGTTLVGQQVSHTYVNTGTTDLVFTVTLTATSAYGCPITAQHSITIHPLPTASFLATPFGQTYPDATVSINNTTATGQWNYAWSFGDGSSTSGISPAPHTYANWGTYVIALTVQAGACTDTATQTIIIDPPLPTASFIGSGEGCAPLTISFINTSLLGNGYQWQFGDGGSGIATDPVYVYNTPGTYTITLTAFGPGGGTSTAVKVDSVIVHPRATAYFTVQPNEVNVPGQPLFTYNLSNSATAYTWDFGDGTFSNETNPVHFYQSPGSYGIQLVANNGWNCPDTFAIPGAVTAIQSGELTFPNAFSPGSNGPGDGIYDPNSLDNDIFHPLSTGVEKYKLQVFNRWGEMIFETEDINQGWDGYYRGKPAKQDVYVWKAFARFVTGDEKKMTGDLTLLR
ncbi:MAG: PKD domain-containing protein [Flavobacteriales bacterium]|jgi:gliding motility-associated-like protein|nr:PKD domain-containing protein [Flavobacteriales bacterium]